MKAVLFLLKLSLIPLLIFSFMYLVNPGHYSSATEDVGFWTSLWIYALAYAVIEYMCRQKRIKLPLALLWDMLIILGLSANIIGTVIVPIIPGISWPKHMWLFLLEILISMGLLGLVIAVSIKKLSCRKNDREIFE